MEKIDWGSLPFGYFKTDYNVRCYYRDGKWGEVEISSSEYVNIHIAATCLHYGQEAFEGMKAFRGKDGSIRVFRWNENAKRFRVSARGIMMAEVPDELFEEAIMKALKLNLKYVPPYGTGAALYFRPLLL
ncbi:MAG: branched chain amino acid aminotransferase, partial [Bacteroidales bacterium]|nr:branched chain amino acid aminotransferase [Bacteroidales bacterium]